MLVSPKTTPFSVLICLALVVIFTSCGNTGSWHQVNNDSRPPLSFKYKTSSINIADIDSFLLDFKNGYTSESDSIKIIEKYVDYLENSFKNEIVLNGNEILSITDSGKLNLSTDNRKSWRNIKLPPEEHIEVKQLFIYNKNGFKFYIINCETNKYEDNCYYTMDLSKWYSLYVNSGSYHVIADSNKLKLLMSPLDDDGNTIETFELIPCKPASIAAFKKTDYPDKIKLELKLNIPSKDISGISLRLWGADKYHYEKDEWSNINWHSYFSGNIWKIEFNTKDISLVNGDKFFIQAFFIDDSFQNRYYIGPLQYSTYDWLKENKGHILIIAGVVSYFILLSLLLLFKPYWIFLIYSKIKIPDPLKEIMGKYGKLADIISSITFFPLFVRHKRVLDAWIESNQIAILNTFDSNPLSLNADDYVPLPLKVGHTSNGRLIDVPSAEIIGDYFKSHRTSIQIIGVGGSGKSTLAFQIGRWTSQKSNNKYFSNHIRLPIIIDQEINDIIKFIQNHLTLCLGEVIDKKFILALLLKQRLLLIVDALSERSNEMQDYFKIIHASIPLNALIITSRKRQPLKVQNLIELYPQSLGSDKLLFYLTSLINTRDVPLFKSLNNQIKLAEKISLLFTFKNQEVPIIPILLRLLLEKVFDTRSETNIDQVLERVPNSIPDVYFDYLNNVNPKTDITNPVPNSTMRSSAELIAKLSLDDDFVPKDIPENIITNHLIESALFTDSILPVKRLKDNGILIVRQYAGTDFVRFIYDPLSEYLAAMWWANDCGKTKAKWDALYNRVNTLPESTLAFKQALRLIHYTYWEKFYWCAPEEFGE